METDDDYVVVTGLRGHDPDGLKLQRMLQAQAAMERARRTRTRMIHLLAGISAPLAVVSGAAGALPGLRAVALAAWATAAGGLVIAAAAAWSYGRKRASLMEDLESSPRRAR
jgi:membrane associated rhomboid family serine protease